MQAGWSLEVNRNLMLVQSRCEEQVALFFHWAGSMHNRSLIYVWFMDPSEQLSEEIEHQKGISKRQRVYKSGSANQNVKTGHTSQERLDSGDVWRVWKLLGARSVKQC